MNNHDRAKRIADAIRVLHGTDVLVDHIRAVLDATEPPDGLMAANQEYLLRRYQCHSDPKPRPAFIGDEVHYYNTKVRVFIIAQHWSHPSEFVYTREPRYDTVDKSSIEHLRHPDGAPVSRIIEHRRPIPVSERLPTREDTDERGNVLAFDEMGVAYVDLWSDIRFDKRTCPGSHYRTWLPCPESGVK